MTIKLLVGDARQVLRDLADDSVDCCVTSPPYWGLRDYGNGDAGIGLEPSLEQYLKAIVYTFEEVRRVLKPDGTLWLNLGDAYARDPKKGASGARTGRINARAKMPRKKARVQLKPKDLMGLPWRVAFALQDAGWWLRCDVIWNKPNGMPNGAGDRPSRTHEYVFMLTKSESYYYDADAIAEEITTTRSPRRKAKRTGFGHAELRPGGKAYDGTGETRNARSVWEISTEPLAEAHFAAFPTRLPERCILASCRPGGVVLDPFGGAGTTGLVADRLQRNAILVEINPEYAALLRRRIDGDIPPLLSPPVAIVSP